MIKQKQSSWLPQVNLSKASDYKSNKDLLADFRNFVKKKGKTYENLQSGSYFNNFK
jgi:hypothetical protein